MLTATSFSYDNKHSSEFGLLIAQLNADNIQNTTPFTHNVNSSKSSRQKRFLFTGINVEEPPQYQFSIFSQEPINDFTRREVLSWLIGKNGFKKLIFDQQDRIEYTYNCIFSDVEIIYHLGNCVGFTVTATFDSQYCYGIPRRQYLIGDGTKKNYNYNAVVISKGTSIKVNLDDVLMDTASFNILYVSKDGSETVQEITIYAGHTSGETSIGGAKNPVFANTGTNTFSFTQESEYRFIKIRNESDITNDYFYPVVRFSGTKIQIVNLSDPADLSGSRVFSMEGLTEEEDIVVDNDLKIITSSKHGNKLSQFNNNWLRLVSGLNILKIFINGKCEIEVTPIVKMGF